MGVKSTQQITRSDAEGRYVKAYVQIKTNQRREKAEARIEEGGYIGQPYRYGVDIPDMTEKAMVEIYLHVDASMREDGWKTKARTITAPMTDAELEDALERLNDEANGGEGFENYTIVEHPHERY